MWTNQSGEQSSLDRMVQRISCWSSCSVRRWLLEESSSFWSRSHCVPVGQYWSLNIQYMLFTNLVMYLFTWETMAQRLEPCRIFGRFVHSTPLRFTEDVWMSTWLHILVDIYIRSVENIFKRASLGSRDIMRLNRYTKEYSVNHFWAAFINIEYCCRYIINWHAYV